MSSHWALNEASKQVSLLEACIAWRYKYSKGNPWYELVKYEYFTF